MIHEAGRRAKFYSREDQSYSGKFWTEDYPQLRIVRFSGEALTTGIQIEQIEGIPVKIYNPAKTIADCFKYRNKIGLDVAKEALIDCRRHKLYSKDELWKYAQICRFH